MRGPIVLEPYQADSLREALSRDEDGNFKYDLIVWSDIKKSAKSTIAAATALWMAHHTDWAEIYLIANDLNQAHSRVAHYLRRAIMLNPELTQSYRQAGYKTSSRSNGSVIEAVPIDPSGEAGSNADMIQFSELWGANEEAKGRMWSEMTLSPTKFGRSFRWVESYAGFSEESLLLHNLWENGVKRGERAFPDKLYQDNENPNGSLLDAFVNDRMFCLWNATPRCPWQTEEYYKSERIVLTPNEFARMHRNQWVTSEETFIPIEWWDGCERETLPPLKRDEPVIVSMDAAVSDDTFGLMMMSKHPEFDSDVCVRYAKKWTPPKRGRLDFRGTEENPGPEMELRRLCEEHNVIEVTYDEHQLADMAMRLSREGIAWFKRFGQGNDRLVADSMLRDKIRDRRIWHTGEPEVREHLNNANAKIDEKEDRKIRIVKRAQKLKIDLAVTMSQAVHEIMRLNL